MSFRPHIIHRPLQITPRRDRDMERGRRAYAAARDAGKTAMECACAQIDATFSPAHFINDFKRSVEVFLRDGADSMRTRARFSSRAEQLDRIGLDRAIYLVEHWYRLEVQAVRLAAQFGRGKTRLPSMILKEARLALRWLRFRGMADRWPAILAVLTEVAPRSALQAAE